MDGSLSLLLGFQLDCRCYLAGRARSAAGRRPGLAEPRTMMKVMDRASASPCVRIVAEMSLATACRIRARARQRLSTSPSTPPARPVTPVSIRNWRKIVAARSAQRAADADFGVLRTENFASKQADGVHQAQHQEAEREPARPTACCRCRHHFQFFASILITLYSFIRRIALQESAQACAARWRSTHRGRIAVRACRSPLERVSNQNWIQVHSEVEQPLVADSRGRRLATAVSCCRTVALRSWRIARARTGCTESSSPLNLKRLPFDQLGNSAAAGAQVVDHAGHGEGEARGSIRRKLLAHRSWHRRTAASAVLRRPSTTTFGAVAVIVACRATAGHRAGNGTLNMVEEIQGRDRQAVDALKAGMIAARRARLRQFDIRSIAVRRSPWPDFSCRLDRVLDSSSACRSKAVRSVTQHLQFLIGALSSCGTNMSGRAFLRESGRPTSCAGWSCVETLAATPMARVSDHQRGQGRVAAQAAHAQELEVIGEHGAILNVTA